MDQSTTKRAVIQRRRGIPHRKWSAYETTLLVDFIKENDFEKPTGRIFYQKFLHTYHLNIQWTLVRNKTRNLRTLYEKTLKWLNSEDAIKMAEGIAKQSFIEKMCPHFDDLNEVFCERTNIQKLKASPKDDQSMVERECFTEKLHSYTPETGCMSEETKDPHIEPKIEDITVDEQMFVENDLSRQNQPIPPTKRKATEDIGVGPCEVNHHSCKYLMEVIKIMSSLINERNDYQHARLELDRSRFDFEKDRMTKELQLREKELEQNERLKILEIDSRERIALKELEYKFKLS